MALTFGTYLLTTNEALDIRTLFVSFVLFDIIRNTMEDVPKSFAIIKEV